MDIELILSSLCGSGVEWPEDVSVLQVVQSIRHDPGSVHFTDGQSLEEIANASLIERLCNVQHFSRLSASGKSIVMALWSFIRRRLVPVSIHGQHKHSLIDLTLVEIIYSHLLKSHLQPSWVRSITTWFSLVHQTEEDVLGVALQSMQQYLDVLTACDLKALQTLVSSISPVFSLSTLNEWSLLHFACSISDQSYRFKDVFSLLTNAGVSVSALDDSLSTPLHIAAQALNHGAILALISYPQLNKSRKNKHGQTALDVFARTLSTRAAPPHLSSDKIVDMIKHILPGNDAMSLWESWVKNNDDNDSSHSDSVHLLQSAKHCPIYHICANCDESVAIDLIAFCTVSGCKLTENHKDCIFWMAHRCVESRPRLLLKLLHLYLRVNIEITRRRQSDNKQREIDVKDSKWGPLQLFKDLLKHYNALMVVACCRASRESRKLLAEIWWTEIVSQLNTNPNAHALLLELCRSSQQYGLFFSRYHVYLLVDEAQCLQHELKSVPDDISESILFGHMLQSASIAQKEVANSTSPSTMTLEELTAWVQGSESDLSHQQWLSLYDSTIGPADNNCPNSSVQQMMKFPLMVWNCILHNDSNPTSTSQNKSNDRTNDRVIGSLDSSKGQQLFTGSEFLFRKFSTAFESLTCKLPDEEIPAHWSALVSTMLTHSLLMANYCSFKKILAILGPQRTMTWMVSRDTDGHLVTIQQSLLSMLLSSAVQTSALFLTQEGHHRIVHRSPLLDNMFSFMNNVVKSNVFSFLNWNAVTFDQSCVEKNSVEAFIVKDKYTLRDFVLTSTVWQINARLLSSLPELMQNQLLTGSNLNWLLLQIVTFCPESKMILEYYSSRQWKWKNLASKMCGTDTSFRVGLRKVASDSFVPDEKWLRFAFLFVGLMEFFEFAEAQKSSGQELQSEGKSDRERYRESLGFTVASAAQSETQTSLFATDADVAEVDKSHWKSFIRLISSATRSKSAMDRFLRRLLQLKACPSHAVLRLSLQSCSSAAEGLLCWDDILDNPELFRRWNMWKRRVSQPSSVRVILPRTNQRVIGERESIFDVDLAAFLRKDRQCKTAFELLSTLFHVLIDDCDKYVDIVKPLTVSDNSSSSILHFSMNPDQISHDAKARDIAHIVSNISTDAMNLLSFSTAKANFFNLLCVQEAFNVLDFYCLSLSKRTMPPKTYSLGSLVINFSHCGDEAKHWSSMNSELISCIGHWQSTILGKRSCLTSHIVTAECCLTERYHQQKMCLKENLSNAVSLLIEHSDRLFLSASSSAPQDSTEQIALVLDLCLRKQYAAATIALSLYEAKEDTGIHPRFARNHPLHVFYRYCQQTSGESISLTLARYRREFLLGKSSNALIKKLGTSLWDNCQQTNSSTVLQITPLLLALLDGEIEFLKRFLAAIPWFPCHLEQLIEVAHESGAESDLIPILAHFHVLRNSDMGPVALNVSLLDWSAHDADVGGNSRKVSDQQIMSRLQRRMLRIRQRKLLRLRSVASVNTASGVLSAARCEAICMQVWQAFVFHNLEVVRNPQLVSERADYALNDHRLLYEYCVLADDDSSFENGQEVKHIALQLMDGTRVPLRMLLDNPKLLNRALPSPRLQPANLSTVLVRHFQHDAVAALVEYNPRLLQYLEEPTAHGDSMLSCLVSGDGFPMIAKLLRDREKMSNSATPSKSDEAQSRTHLIPKYSLTHWLNTYAKHEYALLNSQQLRISSQQVLKPISTLGRILSDDALQYRSGDAVSKGLDGYSLQQHLSLAFQYAEKFWKAVVLSRNFLPFLQYSVSSSVWSKLDSISRARQILTILGIPYSMLHNMEASLPTVNEEEELKRAQRRKERESLIEFDPYSLARRLSLSQCEQLRKLVCGWYRVRQQNAIDRKLEKQVQLVSAGLPESEKYKVRGKLREEQRKKNTTKISAVTASVGECLFVFHAASASCVRMAMSLDHFVGSELEAVNRQTIVNHAAEVRRRRMQEKTSSQSFRAQESNLERQQKKRLQRHENERIYDERLETRMTVLDSEELLRVELSTQVDSILSPALSLKLAPIDTQNLSEAIRSAAILIEFARWLCVCRFLSLATFDPSQQMPVERDPVNDSDDGDDDSQEAKENRERAKLSMLRLKTHPLHRLHHSLTRWKEYSLYLDYLCQQMAKNPHLGVRSSLQIVEQATATTLRTALRNNRVNSTRLLQLQSFLGDALSSLLMDCGQLSLSEIINRMLIEAVNEEHSSSEANKDQTNDENASNNRSSKSSPLDRGDASTGSGSVLEKIQSTEKYRIYQNDLQALQSLLEFVKSLTIEQIVAFASQHKFAKFLAVFNSSSEYVGMEDVPEFLSLLRQLKRGDALEINAKEERVIQLSLADVGALTAFRKETLHMELSSALSISLSVWSEFYWWLSAVYGLIVHVSGSQSAEMSTTAAAYQSSWFAADEAIQDTHRTPSRLLFVRSCNPYACARPFVPDLHRRLPQSHSLYRHRSQLQLEEYQSSVESLQYLSRPPRNCDSMELTLYLIGCGALCGNHTLLLSIDSATGVGKMIQESPRVREQFKHLIFFVLCLCPAPSFGQSRDVEFAMPQQNERLRRQTEIARQQYEKTVMWLLSHKLSAVCPTVLRQESISTANRLNSLDLALVKYLAIDVVQALSVSLNAFVSQSMLQSHAAYQRSMPSERELLRLNEYEKTKEIERKLNSSSELTLMLLSMSARLCMRDNERLDYKELLRERVQVSQWDSSAQMHSEEKIFGFTSNLLVCSLDASITSLVALSETTAQFEATIRPTSIAAMQWDARKVAKSVTESIRNSLFYLSTKFNDLQAISRIEALAVPAQEENHSYAPELMYQLRRAQYRSVFNPVLRDLLSFAPDTGTMALGPMESNAVDCNWSLLSLAIYSGEIRFFESVFSSCTLFTKFASTDSRDEDLSHLIRSIQELLLLSLSLNDILMTKAILAHVSVALDASGPDIKTDVVSGIFSAPMSLTRPWDTESTYAQPFDILFESRSFVPVLEALLALGVRISTKDFVRRLCRGRITEEALCLLLLQFARQEDSPELSDRVCLAEMDRCYDEDSGEELLNGDTVLHVICRRKLASVASLWCRQILQLPVTEWSPSLFVLTQLRRDSHEVHTQSSVLVDSVNLNNENVLSICIAQGDRSLTQAIGQHCPAYVHDAARKIAYVFRTFALSREMYLTRLSERREKDRHRQYEEEEQVEDVFDGDGQDDEYDSYYRSRYDDNEY